MYKHLTSQITLHACTLVLLGGLMSYCTGCNSQHETAQQVQPTPTTTEKVPMRFSSHIEGESRVRVIASQWETGDEVGVFLLTPNAQRTSQDVIQGYSNLKFVREQDGHFYPADKGVIHFPTTPERLDIIGYYPYKAVGADLSYSIDLKENPDFLYAGGLKGFKPQEYTEADLVFKRPLSQLNINIATSATATDISVRVKDVPITGAFNLLNGTLTADESSKGDLVVATKKEQENVIASTRLFPGQQNVVVEITYQNKLYKYTITPLLEGGKTYTQNFRFAGEKLEPTASPSPYTEIPIYGDGKHLPPHTKMILHTVPSSWLNNPLNGVKEPRNYSMLYDTELRMPLWVAYPLHKTYRGNTKRTNAWNFDPMLANNLQPDLNTGWRSAPERVDRGHLLPSADRTSSRDINKTTFYFTNMSAQASKFNQGSWQRLESRVRDLISPDDRDTLFVVIGCIPYPEAERATKVAEDNNGELSAYPQYMYKLLARKDLTTGQYKTIGFNFPNTATAPSHTSASVVCTVEEVEKLTGLTFFPTLPKEAKQQKDLSDWNL